MGETEMMSQCRGLRDFVPEVLNVAIPEISDQSLLRGASLAGDETQTLDFIETSVYSSLVNCGGGPGRNSSARARANGVTWGHCMKSAGAKLGGVNS